MNGVHQVLLKEGNVLLYYRIFGNVDRYLSLSIPLIHYGGLGLDPILFILSLLHYVGNHYGFHDGGSFFINCGDGHDDVHVHVYVLDYGHVHARAHVRGRENNHELLLNVMFS